MLSDRHGGTRRPPARQVTVSAPGRPRVAAGAAFGLSRRRDDSARARRQRASSGSVPHLIRCKSPQAENRSSPPSHPRHAVVPAADKESAVEKDDGRGGGPARLDDPGYGVPASGWVPPAGAGTVPPAGRRIAEDRAGAHGRQAEHGGRLPRGACRCRLPGAPWPPSPFRGPGLRALPHLVPRPRGRRHHRSRPGGPPAPRAGQRRAGRGVRPVRQHLPTDLGVRTPGRLRRDRLALDLRWETQQLTRKARG